MSRLSGKLAKRIRGAAVFLIIALALALCSARLATYYVKSGSKLADVAALPQELAARPLEFDFGNQTVLLAALAAAAVPLVLAVLLYSHGEKLDNEDTGREHGDDRLATKKEMKALRDKKHFSNNVLYSRRCWLARTPCDKKTKEILDGRNLNCITLGISGLGKTFNLVWPDLLQSLGDSLKPLPYGVRNVPEHVLARLGRKEYYDGNSGQAKKRAEGLPSGVADGFDVFCTDPKGDNVRDVGGVYERAGYKVKVINTIDFEDGLHYNPLAYIKTHAVDVKAAEEIKVCVKVTGPESMREDAPEITKEFPKPLTAGSMLDISGGAGNVWRASARLDLKTVRNGVEGSDLGMSLDEIEAEMKKRGLSEQRREELARARDVAIIRNEVTYGGKVPEAMDAVSYRHSSGAIEVTFRNTSAWEMDAVVEIDVDDALVIDGQRKLTNGWIEWPRDEHGDILAGGTVKWHIEGTKARLRGRHARKAAHAGEGQTLVGAERFVCEKLVLDVHVKPCIVPDGVSLTKTVDCLVSNLKGTDAQSNGSEDPFWDDTKRLAFMALIAFLFERYTPQYRTLPEMMGLLNMALADSGDPQDQSPLDSLMEMWEYGRRYVGEKPGTGRYSSGGARYEKANNPPHSRNDSLALHCYHAFTSGAPETVQSVIISCQACLVNLITDQAKEFLSCDELELDTLGDPGQKQIIFCVTKDTNSPFDFLTALVVYQAIDLAQDKAYKVYGGKLPRHVRFVLDEAANIGKIPILVRALAVVRSRNISISMYLQSKAQLALVYGEKEADVIFDNCTSIVFLGAQTEDTLEEMSKKVGTETVQTRMFQRSFNSNSLVVGSSSEQIQSNERRVKSASQMGRMEKGWLMLFVFNSYPVFDHKYETFKHPYYAYINPDSKRTLLCPMARCKNRFDYQEYRKRTASSEAEGPVVPMG